METNPEINEKLKEQQILTQRWARGEEVRFNDVGLRKEIEDFILEIANVNEETRWKKFQLFKK